MRKLSLSIVLLGLLAVGYLLPFAGSVRAQGEPDWPTLNGVVAADTGDLDVQRLNSAAKPLQNNGAKVLVLMMNSIAPFNNFDDFSDEAFLHYGLGTDQRDSNGNQIVDPNLYALVVTLNPRTILVRYGDKWKSALEAPGSGGGTQADAIREAMIPLLTQGDFSGAFESGLRGGNSVISNFINPPTAVPQPTAPPTVINNTEVDTSGLGRAILIGLVILLVVGVLIAFGPWLLRTLREGRERAAERRKILDAIKAERGQLAGLLTTIQLPANPEEQIDYRFLKLALQNERPQQLAAITQEYNQTQQLFGATLERFTALNEQQPGPATDTPELQRILAEYQQLQAQANQVSDFVTRMNKEASDVQQQSAGAPQELDRAKKARATAAEEYAALPAVAPLNFPPADQWLAPADARLQQADAELAAKHPLMAYDIAGSVQPTLDKLRAAATAVDNAFSAISQSGTAITGFEQQGFGVGPGRDLLAQADKKVRAAAAALGENADTASAAAAEAQDLAVRANSVTEGRARLHAENERRLADLDRQGQQLSDFIAQGRTAFDAVDEYAESSWDDIRGNGSEAQISADRAHALWEEATARNSMSAGAARLDGSGDGATRSFSNGNGAEQPTQSLSASSGDTPVQDFEGAAQRLDEAAKEIARARGLVQGILDRLQNLRESQNTAQKEISTAVNAIAMGRSFIAQHDVDITPSPEHVLDQADQLLDVARDEIDKQKPDWILIVKNARQANDLAGQALADARNQEQKLAALRQQLETARQQAQTSVSRTRNFAQAHQSDLRDASVALLMHAEDGRDTARTQERGMQGLEDERLATAISAAIAAYQSTQAGADGAYQQMYQEFSVMESLRGAVDSAIRGASQSINDAASYISYNTGVSYGARNHLDNARRLMPVANYRRDISKEELETIRAQANRATQEARTALSIARNDVAQWAAEEEAAREAEAASSSSWFGGGGWLSGGGSSSSGSSGSSGGGFSWGSGGSSSSSWGGGSHSSSSFGGGGSSHSSFGGGGKSSSGW